MLLYYSEFITLIQPFGLTFVALPTNVIRDLHRRLHHIDCRPGGRRQLAACASEVDRSRRYLSDRHSDHPWRDGDSTKGSDVLNRSNKDWRSFSLAQVQLFPSPESDRKLSSSPIHRAFKKL
jgi:hypothetical protein